MKSLQQLISEKESELQNLEDSLGLGFPIVEQAKMVQISHLQLELEDLRQIEVVSTQRQPANRVGVVETNCTNRKANASCILDDE